MESSNILATYWIGRSLRSGNRRPSRSRRRTLTTYRIAQDDFGRCRVSLFARIASRMGYFDRDGGSAHVYALASIPTITSSNLGERHAVCSASASFTAVIFRTTLLL